MLVLVYWDLPNCTFTSEQELVNISRWTQFVGSLIRWRGFGGSQNKCSCCMYTCSKARLSGLFASIQMSCFVICFLKQKANKPNQKLIKSRNGVNHSTHVWHEYLNKINNPLKWNIHVELYFLVVCVPSAAQQQWSSGRKGPGPLHPSPGSLPTPRRCATRLALHARH